MNAQIIQDICTTALNSSQQLRGVFLSEGKDLTWVLFSISIGYQLWAMLINDGQQLLVNIFKNILIASIILFLLTHWNSVVAHFFFKSVNSLAQKISPKEKDSTLTIFFELLSHISNNSYFSGISLSPQKIVAATIGNFAAVILKIAAEIAIIITMGAYIIVLYMGGVLLSISIMIGPILCPWLLLGPCQFLFHGWLRFTISAALYQIVGSAMSYICRSSIKQLHQLQQSFIPDYISPDQTILVLVMIVCFVFLTLFWNIPGICQGIISGGVHLSTTHIRQSLDLRKIFSSSYTNKNENYGNNQKYPSIMKSLRRKS
ncbi:type IV secretion system protein [Candidatus Ichthyocystis hellenicum]|uniref:type IV secretion system protein n=1 Tax=Candidatus Ichthyocystis hellenicum TaxID=1561003 RepID=UPI000B80AD0E|nr:type IV secretion system protein [Candidatus Ichthyocystis hellenicum]